MASLTDAFYTEHVTDADPAVDDVARLFAARLTERRDARGMKQRDLAYELDIGEREVYRWEAGTPRGPKIQTLRGLALALDTSVDYLLGLTDDPRARVAIEEPDGPRGELVGLARRAAERLAEAQKDDRRGGPRDRRSEQPNSSSST